MEFVDKKNIFFIPGWMHSCKYYGMNNGVDIWKDNFFLNEKVNSQFVAGHSLGANYCLYLYKKGFDFEKIILVNPVFSTRNFFSLALRWILHAIFEKTNSDKISVFRAKHFLLSLPKIFKILSINYDKIIETIPKDKIIVIRGKEDRFLCGKRTVDLLERNGIQLFNIKNANHNWCPEFKNKIFEICNKN